MVTVTETVKEPNPSPNQPQDGGPDPGVRVQSPVEISPRPVVQRQIAEDNSLDNDYYIPNDAVDEPTEPTPQPSREDNSLDNDYYIPDVDNAQPEKTLEQHADEHVLTNGEFNNVYMNSVLSEQGAAKVHALHKKTGINPKYLANNLDAFEKEYSKYGGDVKNIILKSKALQRYAAQGDENFPFIKKDASVLYTIEQLVADNFKKNRLNDQVAAINDKVQNGIPLTKADIAERARLRGQLGKYAAIDEDLTKAEKVAGMAAIGTAQGGTSLVESLPYIAGGAAAGAFAGGMMLNPVTALAAIGTGATAGAAYGAWKTSQPREFSGAYEAFSTIVDVDGKPLDEKEIIQAAKIASYINAAIESGGDALTLSLLVGGGLAAGTALAAASQKIKQVAGNKAKQYVIAELSKKMATAAGRSMIMRGGINLLSEGFQEGVQEIPGIVLEKQLKEEAGGEFPENKMTGPERVGEATASGFFGAGPLTILGFGGSHIVNKQIQKYGQYFQDAYLAQLLKQETNKNAQQLTTAKLSPDKTTELFQEITRDTDVTHVGVNVEKFAEVMQAKGLDPRQEAINLVGDDGTVYDNATKENGDVRIPLANYIAKVSANTEMKDLDQHAKYGDAPFSYEEMVKRYDEVVDGSKEAQQETVYDIFVKEAEIAVDPISAHHMASVVAARYEKRAKRLSTPEKEVSALDLFKEDRISVRESTDLNGDLEQKNADRILNLEMHNKHVGEWIDLTKKNERQSYAKKDLKGFPQNIKDKFQRDHKGETLTKEQFLEFLNKNMVEIPKLEPSLEQRDTHGKWYLRSEKLLEEQMQGMDTPERVLSILSNISHDEYETLNIEGFLQNNMTDGGLISKSQLLDHIKKNSDIIQTKVKYSQTPEQLKVVEKLKKERADINKEALEIAETIDNQVGNATYPEVEVTKESVRSRIERLSVLEKRSEQISKNLKELEVAYNRYENYMGRENPSDIPIELPLAPTAISAKAHGGLEVNGYQAFAWLRGMINKQNKTLFVQEIQSDTHQYAGLLPNVFGSLKDKFPTINKRKEKLTSEAREAISNFADKHNLSKLKNSLDEGSYAITNEINKLKSSSSLSVGDKKQLDDLGTNLESSQFFSWLHDSSRTSNKAIPFSKTQEWVKVTVKEAIHFAIANDLNTIIMRSGDLQQVNQGYTDEPITNFYDKTVKSVVKDILKSYGVPLVESERTVKNNREYNNSNTPSVQTKTFEFVITPAMKERVLAEGFSVWQQDKINKVLGSASVTAMGALVKLGPDPNVSTFLHEMSHVFFHHEIKDFETISKMENRSATQEQFLADMSHVKEWFVSYGGGKAFKDIKEYAAITKKRAKETKEPRDEAAATLAQFAVDEVVRIAGENKTTPDKVMDEVAQTFGMGVPDANLRLFLMRPYHELFAKASEKYFGGGKAPTSALKRAFQYFRRFIIDMYGSLSRIGVSMPKEITEYFDRMYQINDKIESDAALLDLGYSAEDLDLLDLTPEQTAKIADLISESQAHIDHRVYAAVKKDMEKEEAYKKSKARDLIEGEVTREVQAEKNYVVESLISKGKNPDGTIPEGFVHNRPSKKEIIDRFGKEVFDLLPRGFTVPKGGMALDMVADQHQFVSGDALIKEMISLKPIKQEIQERTDKILDQTFESEITPESVENAAKEATHTISSAKILRLKYQYAIINHPEAFKDIIKQIPRIPNDEELEIMSERTVANMRVTDVRPSAFLATERRHARLAADAAAKGDWEQYVKSKRDQIISHGLFKAAQKAKKLVDSRLSELKALYANDPSIRNTRDLDLVYTARALLVSIGLMRQSKKTQEQIMLIKENDPSLYVEIGSILDEYAGAQPTSYRQIRFGEFDTVTSTAMALWDKSRTDKLFEIEGQMVEYETIFLSLAESFGRFTEKKQKEVKTKEGKSRVQDITSGASLRRAASLAESIDGGFGGAYHKYIFLPVKHAIDRLSTMRTQHLSDVDEITRKNVKSFKDNKLYETKYLSIDGKALKFSKVEILSILLNMGSESNIKKLEKNGFVTVDKDGRVDSSRLEADILKFEKDGVITKADRDMVQAYLDRLNEIKPELQQAYKLNNGKYMGEIKARPQKSIHGEYAGGYYPVIYDKRSGDFLSYVKDLSDKSISVAEMKNGVSLDHLSPSANISATRERTEVTIAPIDLDMTNFASHLELVMRYITLSNTIRKTHKLVNSSEFRSMAGRYYPDLVDGTILPWLDRTLYQATKESDTRTDAWNGILRHIMKSASSAYLVLNPGNTVQQITGGLSVASGILGKQGTMYMAKNSPSGIYAMRKDLILESAFMTNRLLATAQEMARNIYGIEDTNSVADKMIRFGFIPQAALQHRVDIIVWLSAYDLGTARGLSKDLAKDFADVTVEKSQGHFSPESISNFESGSQFMKLVFQFYPYMNMKYNVLANIYANSKAKTNDKVPIQSAGSLWAFSMAFVAETALDTAVRLTIKNAKMSSDDWEQWADEDQDGWKLDDMALIAGVNGIRNIVGTNPLAGIAFQAAAGIATKGTRDDVISLPAFRMVEAVTYGSSKLVKAVDRSVGFYLTDPDTNSVENMSSKQLDFDRRQMAEALGFWMGGVPIAPVVNTYQLVKKKND